MGTRNVHLEETDRTFRNISKPSCITFLTSLVCALKQLHNTGQLGNILLFIFGSIIFRPITMKFVLNIKNNTFTYELTIKRLVIL